MAFYDRERSLIVPGSDATLSGVTTAEDRRRLSSVKAAVAGMTPSQRPVNLYPLYGRGACSSAVQSRCCGVPAMNLLKALAEGKF